MCNKDSKLEILEKYEEYIIFNAAKSAGFDIMPRSLTDADKYSIEYYWRRFPPKENTYTATTDIKSSETEYEKVLRRWILQYDNLIISAYYDTADLLGLVNEPYYELYVINNPFDEFKKMKEYIDPERFHPTDQSEMINYLNVLKDIYDDYKIQHPEYLV
jgi:hypothetical protein